MTPEPAGGPGGGVRLRGLGQAGVAVEGGGRRLLIDPYLSDWLERPGPANPEPVTRARPAPVAPEEIEPPDLVLCTHEHPDHLDPGTVAVLARRSPATTFVVPLPLTGQLAELGVAPDRILGVAVDTEYEVAGVSVLAIPSAHAFAPGSFGGYTYWLDDQGRHRAVGYVVSVGGVRLYHSGDTVYWPGMDERLAELSVDVGVLPINGRDWRRERAGLVGNLSAVESADLAAAAGFGTVVPCHYDGIVGNTADPAEFVAYLTRTYPSQRHALFGEEDLTFP